MATELESAGLPPAVFYDAGIRFTVLLHHSEASATAARRLRPTEARVYGVMRVGEPVTTAKLMTQLGLSESSIQKALNRLVDRGIAVRAGGQGRVTTYERRAE